LKKIAPAEAATAASRSVSAKMMLGDFPPELQGDLFQVAQRGVHDLASHLRGAGERYLVHVRMCGQRRTSLAEAGDDVDHTSGQLGLLHQLRKPES
jgi:hypothetical protein